MASLESRIKKLEQEVKAKQANEKYFKTNADYEEYLKALTPEEIMDTYYSETRKPITPEQKAEQDKWTEGKSEQEMINELLQLIKESYLE